MSQDNGSNQTGTRDLDVTVASQRRRQIIEAARACITEDGVEKLTLRKVGERAQVSHATIAYYFKTRKDLIDSALQEISDDFLDGLRQRQLLYGMGDLVDLVDVFLRPDNESARFVAQMIDAGQHDIELRATHDEFIRYGRERIEQSIRVAMEMGDLRTDVDPVLAAALFHTILIWWQSELAAGATTRDLAFDVGKLLLHVLENREPVGSAKERKQKKTNGARAESGARSSSNGTSTTEIIEASLLQDPNLTSAARLTLVDSFKNLYQMAADMSKREVHP